MADSESSDIAANAEVNFPPAALEEGVRLQFPTIDLANSSASVLSPSSNASTIMPAANERGEALDESWASLDTSDYSHGEDLQSEHTDAESLVDLSSNQDTESVVDEEEHEEHEEHESEELTRDSTIDEHVDRSINPSPRGLQQQNTRYEDLTDDTIILQPSQEQKSSAWSQLEYVCDMLPISVSSTGLRATIEKQVLHMKVSKQHLQPMNKPFHIAYYGVGSARVSRDELLGKIGAALVASTPYQDTSKCYNIFPTEFGPGSTPAFAELIPSQAQMIVDDLTVLRHGPDQPDTIRFALKHGTILESNTAVPSAGLFKAPWRPNLVVVHLCRDDLADDFYTARQVMELAERHHWPVLTLSQDSAAGLYPPYSRDLNKEFLAEATDSFEFAEHPIDLDTFLRIDTDQLNRHIRFVVDAAKAKSQSLHLPSNIVEYVKLIARQLYNASSRSTAQANGYVLEIVEASPKAEVKQSMLETCKAKALHILANPNHRRSLKDLLASLAITALVFLVIAAYQNFPSTGIRTIGPSDRASWRPAVTAVTTVTATSAISTFTQTPTTAVHENSITKGLDQMLQRLMGTGKVDETVSDDDVVQVRPEQNTEPEGSIKSLHRNMYDEVSSSLEGLLSKILVELDAAHKRWNETSEKRTSLPEEEKREQQQTNAFQLRLQQLSDGLTKMSSELHQQSLKQFAKLRIEPSKKLNELIDRSRLLVKKSRRSSAKRIDKLVKDHKPLLKRAKRQADRLTGRKKVVKKTHKKH